MTAAPHEEALLPCPFCQVSGSMHENPGSESMYYPSAEVICGGCGARTKSYSYRDSSRYRDQAASAWNRRALASPPVQNEEALRALGELMAFADYPRNEAWMTLFMTIRAALSAPVQAEPVESDADIWMVYYEDTELKHPEIFKGPGARRAAFHLYKEALINWACHLFRAVSLDGKSSVDAPASPQEPVFGYVYKEVPRTVENEGYCAGVIHKSVDKFEYPEELVPLYLSPPSPEWRTVAERLAKAVYTVIKYDGYADVDLPEVIYGPCKRAYAAVSELHTGQRGERAMTTTFKPGDRVRSKFGGQEYIVAATLNQGSWTEAISDGWRSNDLYELLPSPAAPDVRAEVIKILHIHIGDDYASFEKAADALLAKFPNMGKP